MAETEAPYYKQTLRGALKDLPSPVKIEVSRILDLASSLGRLALVGHRTAEKDSPEILLAWQSFLIASDAADGLSNLLDYGPVEFEA